MSDKWDEMAQRLRQFSEHGETQCVEQEIAHALCQVDLEARIEENEALGLNIRLTSPLVYVRTEFRLKDLRAQLAAMKETDAPKG